MVPASKKRQSTLTLLRESVLVRVFDLIDMLLEKSFQCHLRRTLHISCEQTGTLNQILDPVLFLENVRPRPFLSLIYEHDYRNTLRKPTEKIKGTFDRYMYDVLPRLPATVARLVTWSDFAIGVDGLLLRA